jgi:hypothetical protein
MKIKGYTIQRKRNCSFRGISLLNFTEMIHCHVWSNQKIVYCSGPNVDSIYSWNEERRVRWGSSSVHSCILRILFTQLMTVISSVRNTRHRKLGFPTVLCKSLIQDWRQLLIAKIIIFTFYKILNFYIFWQFWLFNFSKILKKYHV